MEGGAKISNRAEEQQENLLQRRRWEFLMKQANVYAHFMARKLGKAMESERNLEESLGAEIPITVNYSKVDVDETGLKSIQDMINEHRVYLKDFDEDTQKQKVEAGGPIGEVSHLEKCELNELIDAQKLETPDFSSGSIGPKLETPKSFHGDLKDYQLEGLRWLDNLYKQGINGILADEMGLGKTVQTIALLSHISENKGNWGPFLVVAPTSTLHNWQQEIHRFAPNLKVLPYWGSLQERKTLKKYFQQKYWGSPNSQFHVVVTSYQLIIADEKVFHKMKWQYMVLDEAQAIKNTNSLRWKTLMSFNARNKLLLTYLSIQEAEIDLWALLHFIMPKLFNSNEELQEYFAKDIQVNLQGQEAFHFYQLSKIHAILRPFVLRRTKKDIEKEFEKKKEYKISSEMVTHHASLNDAEATNNQNSFGKAVNEKIIMVEQDKSQSKSTIQKGKNDYKVGMKFESDLPNLMNEGNIPAEVSGHNDKENDEEC